MSDLEGLTRRLINKGYFEQQILERLIQEYHDFKDIDDTLAFKYARAVLEECQKSDINSISDKFISELLDITTLVDMLFNKDQRIFLLDFAIKYIT